MTQTDAIRAHLISGAHLTPLEALDRYGCFRLAARIDELRKEGMNIETITETRNGKKFAKYKLLGQVEMFA